MPKPPPKSKKHRREKKINRIIIIEPQNWSMQKLIRSRNFWFLSLAPFTTGFVANLIVVHQAAYIVGAGYSPAFAASLVGVTGLIGSIGGVLGGMFSDRFTREVSFTLSCLSAAAGVIILACVRDTSSDIMLYAFVLLYGAGHGSMLPINAARTGDLFSGGTLGRILGLLSAGYGIGGALGAFIGGYLYDLTGNYNSSFALIVFCLALGSFGMWMVGNRAVSSTTLADEH
jgi:MFS family permease